MRLFDLEHVQALVEACASLSPEAREAFLRDLGDEGLAAEVRSLLAVYEDVDALPDFLETPLQQQEAFRPLGELMHGPVEELLDPRDSENGGDGAVPDPLLGSAVGPYRLARLIGRGGMGVVYEGERDDDLFEQRVAIKVIRSADPHLQARFHTERAVVAKLSHPNIARLFDGGTTPDGRPYLVMEYVEGVPLDDYCDQRALNLQERLRLFQRVCEAVHHAHQHFVVHRDLKPSNILVDASGTPKLLDFGIAKLLDEEQPQNGHPLTETVGRMLTPEYASPEHIRGEAITVASDVYSLGVVLYRLLSGHSPYRISTHIRYELERMICETDPAPPSTAVTWSGTRILSDGKTVPMDSEYVSSTRSTQPNLLKRRLKGDLDNIVLRALRKEPELRYRSALELFEDIERFLSKKPVLAHKPSPLYRIQKFVLRHSRVAFVSLLLLISIGVAVSQRYAAWKEERDFSIQFDSSLAWLDTLDPRETDKSEVTTISLLETEVSQARERFDDDKESLSRYLSQIGRIYTNFGIHDSAIEIQEEAKRIYDSLPNRMPQFEADLLHGLGMAYLNAHYLELADSLLSRSLELRRALFNVNDDAEPIVESLTALGAVYRERGSLEDANRVSQEAIALASVHLENLDPAALNAMNSLAETYFRIGHLDEAEEIWRNTLELRLKNGRRSHIRTADNLNSIALLLEQRYLQTGNTDYLAESEQILREAIAIARLRLRHGHPLLANALNSLGVILARLGRYSESEIIHQESLSVYRQYIDEYHPDIAGVLANLGYSLFMQGDIPNAVAIYTEAHERTVDRFGSDHERTAHLSLQLGYTLEGTDPNLAHRYSAEAARVYRAIHGSDHPETQLALMQLAKLEMLLDRPAAAEPLVRIVLAHRQATLHSGHWRIGSSQSFLGWSLMLQGRLDEAEPLLLEGYETMRAARGDGDEKVLQAKERIDQLRALQKEMAPTS